jgi:transposase InsO family protein
VPAIEVEADGRQTCMTFLNRDSWKRFAAPVAVIDQVRRQSPAASAPAIRPRVPFVGEVGWSMSAAMTAQLVTDALIIAIWRRGKPDALLHHSDRGSQYTSEQFQRLMADHGVVCSMSRSGNAWDNAAMESFFSSLKTERTARKTYRTRDEAKADVFDYIELFYNVKRRHSTIGYMSPLEFEMQAGLP